MNPPKGRILCTEDDADTRDLLVFTLTQAGFEVDCVDTAVKALELSRTRKIDLYLLDNWMPDTSGLQLCKHIRMFDRKTPIVFYSGAADDKERALEAGAQAYLVKPVVGETLVAEITRLTSKQKAAA